MARRLHWKSQPYWEPRFRARCDFKNYAGTFFLRVVGHGSLFNWMSSHAHANHGLRSHTCVSLNLGLVHTSVACVCSGMAASSFEWAAVPTFPPGKRHMHPFKNTSTGKLHGQKDFLLVPANILWADMRGDAIQNEWQLCASRKSSAIWVWEQEWFLHPQPARRLRAEPSVHNWPLRWSVET